VIETKVYQGKATGTVVGAKKVLVDGKPLKHVVKHSPSGFNWGYRGSGPADLAYAILYDLYGKKVADRLYQQFKHDIIAQLPQDEDWTLTEDHIEQWKKLT
jgi:hypothetical protein